MKYGIYVKFWDGRAFRYARPWTYDTWKEAKEAAATARSSGNYEAVYVRKIPAVETKVTP